MNPGTKHLIAIAATICILTGSAFAQSASSENTTAGKSDHHPTAWLGAFPQPIGGIVTSPVNGLPGNQTAGFPGAPWNGIVTSPVNGIVTSPVNGLPSTQIAGFPGAPWNGIQNFPINGIQNFPINGIQNFPINGIQNFPINGIQNFPINGGGLVPGASLVHYVAVPQYVYVPVMARGQQQTATSGSAAPPQPVVCLLKASSSDADIAVIAESNEACQEISGTVTTASGSR